MKNFCNYDDLWWNYDECKPVLWFYEPTKQKNLKPHLEYFSTRFEHSNLHYFPLFLYGLWRPGQKKNSPYGNCAVLKISPYGSFAHTFSNVNCSPFMLNHYRCQINFNIYQEKLFNWVGLNHLLLIWKWGSQTNKKK